MLNAALMDGLSMSTIAVLILEPDREGRQSPVVSACRSHVAPAEREELLVRP